MNKKYMPTLALTAMLLGLAGCGTPNDNAADHRTASDQMRNAGTADRNGDTQMRNVGTMDRNDGTQMRNVGTNTRTDNMGNAFDNLRISTRAADNVERLKEVDGATVIARGKDAYVAVRLANGQNTANRNTTGTDTTTNTGAGKSGTRTTRMGTGADTGTTGTGTGTTGTGTGTTNAGYAAGYGAGYGASAGTTGAGYGAGLNSSGTNDTTGTDNEALSSDLERKIARQVRLADGSIRNVHVSVDRDLFSRMANYTNTIRDGQNMDGLVNDFTGTVNRFFD